MREYYKNNKEYREYVAKKTSQRRSKYTEVQRAEARKSSRERKRVQLADPEQRRLHNERNQRWCRENDTSHFKHRQREYRSERCAHRRAAKMQATPPWVDREQLQAIYAECARISKATGIEHHVDHIWPLVHEDCCGLHVPWNLQIIPATDNLRKSNKLPDQD